MSSRANSSAGVAPATIDPRACNPRQTHSHASDAMRPQPDLLSLHIGISCDTQGSGGSGRIFSDLVRGLPDCGIAVTGAVHKPSDIAERTAGKVKPFAQRDTGMVRRLFAARSTIRSLIRKTSPDLIASHFAFYTLPVLDELRRSTLIVHFHGPWAEESAQEGAGFAVARAKAAIERAVYSKACCVIVLSHAFADLVRYRYGIPADCIRIVPGAVDVDRFAIPTSREEARRQLGWPSGRRILITVRRLVSRMGLENLITAMSRVSATHPDVLLCIAGKGRLRPALETQVAAAGLTEHVRFVGYVPEEQLPLAYRAAEVNLVPTLALEGFGLVAVEALAAGTPSLVTPVGGLPETVSDLSTDLIFRSASPDDLASGIQQYLSGSLSIPGAVECEAFARSKFSLKRMVGEIADVYRETCKIH